MEIRRLDPTDPEQVDRAYTLMELVHRTDNPELPLWPKHQFAATLACPPPGTEVQVHIAEDADTALGHVQVYLPQKENRHYAEVEMAVHPDRRKQGIGTVLMEHLLEVARAERRTELIVLTRATWEDGPIRSEDGARFLERHGFTAALTEVDRSMEVAAFDAGEERRLWDEATAAAGDDYELVTWTGRTPEEYMASLARIDSRIFEEIPLGDVDLKRREFDVEYVRARDDRAERLGNATVRAVAVHKAGGEIAANTVFYVPDGAEYAHQAITIADPAHRGRRLGLWIKLANLRQLRERFPRVKRIWTGNADVNAHMSAINEKLGFRTVDARVSYKRTLEL